MLKKPNTLLLDINEIVKAISTQLSNAIKAPDNTPIDKIARKYFIYPMIEIMLDSRLKYKKLHNHPRDLICIYLKEDYLPPTTDTSILLKKDPKGYEVWFNDLINYYRLSNISENLNQDIVETIFERYFSNLYDKITDFIHKDNWLVYNVKYLNDTVYLYKTTKDFRIEYFEEHIEKEFLKR